VGGGGRRKEPTLCEKCGRKGRDATELGLGRLLAGVPAICGTEKKRNKNGERKKHAVWGDLPMNKISQKAKGKRKWPRHR